MKRWRPLLLDERLRFVGLVVPEVVGRQRFLHRLDPELDLLGVVGGAVLPEQELEHVGRDVLAALDLVQQVLADDFACERLGELAV